MSHLTAWLRERVGSSGVRDRIPPDLTTFDRLGFTRILGGLALLALVVELVTGPLLLVHYRPGADAYASVRWITQEAHFGWFVRGLHRYASHGLVASALLHAVVTFASRAFVRPRELTWLTGAGLGGVVLACAYTGTVLSGDQHGWYALQVGVRLLRDLPFAGGVIAEVLGARTNVDADTARRCFTLHVGIVPLLGLLVLFAHLALIRVHGLSQPASSTHRPTSLPLRIDRSFVARAFLWSLGAVNALVIVTAFVPPALEWRGDAITPAPMGLRPEWFFLPLYQILQMVPSNTRPISGGVLSLLLVAVPLLALVLVPFWSTDSQRVAGKRIVAGVGLAVLAGLFGLGWWGYLPRGEESALAGQVLRIGDADLAAGLGAVTLVVVHALAGAAIALLVVADRAERDRDSEGMSWVRTSARRLAAVTWLGGVPVVTAMGAVFLARRSAMADTWCMAMLPDCISLLAGPVVLMVTVTGYAWSLGGTTPRLHRACRWILIGAAVVGVAISGWAEAFTLAPDRWIEARSLASTFVFPVAVPLILARASLAGCLGSLLLWFGSGRFHGGAVSVGRSDLLVRISLGSCLVTVASVIWLWSFGRFGGLSNPMTDVPNLTGFHGMQVTRTAFACVLSCMSLAVALSVVSGNRALLSRYPAAVVLVTLAILCAGSGERLRVSAVQPWFVPGYQYANGTTVEQVRLFRRVPTHRSAQAMFSAQCDACHSAHGRFRRTLVDRKYPWVLARLQQLRDADQFGNPYRSVMPPLVGADSEVVALAQWLSEPRTSLDGH